MTDRFSAQLRQHLLDTADERPADGQLASVIDAVAATSQRHPLSARLTWNPDRVGPLPSAALRYGLIAVALVLATVAGALLAGGASGPSTVFEGTWITIDPADGSGMTLVVGPGETPAIYFEDGYASGEACLNDRVKRFTARGAGTIVDDRMNVRWPDGGGCGLVTLAMGEGSYTYDPATDTLVDGLQQTWMRPLVEAPSPTEGADLPTAPPSVSPTAPPSVSPTAPPSVSPTEAPSVAPTDLIVSVPTFVPECLEFHDTATYTAPVGTLSLSVTLPATPDDAWSGLRDSFYTGDSPCLFGSAVKVEASIVSQVYADACDWAGTGTEADSAAAAAAALAAQTGHEVIGHTQTTLDGYPASRLEISIPLDFDASGCDDEILRFWLRSAGTDIPYESTASGNAMTVYFLDVDGSVLALTVSRGPGDDGPALLAQLNSIVASLQIEP
jgi:hypothetical protein